MTSTAGQQSLRAFLICGAALGLQGCVAAAFPLVASGALAGGAIDGRGDETEATTQEATYTLPTPVETTRVAASQIELGPHSEPDPALAEGADLGAAVDALAETSANSEAFDSAFVEATPNASNIDAELAGQIGPEDVASETATTREPVQVEELAASTPDSTAALRTGSGSDAVEAIAETSDVPPAIENEVETARIAVPTPGSAQGTSRGGLIPIPDAPPLAIRGTFFDPFTSYAASPEFAVDDTRISAVLHNPTALRADRRDCERGDSTVLIDLDPENGDLLPIDTGSSAPALQTKLADLRQRGVQIVWISAAPVERISEIERGLRDSGLDPLGLDQVLLPRTADERKQTRRDHLAASSCLIAIAGDERSDFHELYDYLLNPADAAALETMIGNGWFLIPTPLLAERP